MPAVEMPQTELTGAERQAIGRERAGQRVIKAMALLEKVEAEAAEPDIVRAICEKALPAAMRNLVAIATRTGAHAKAPAVAQLQAIKLVAGGAGKSLEAAPGSGGAIPLGEMGLGDLEGTLTGMLNSIQEMRSIAGQAHRVDSTDEVVPHQGSTPPTEAAPG